MADPRGTALEARINMMQLQLGWRPFLGQVTFPYQEPAESRAERAQRLTRSLDDTLSLYSMYRFDSATGGRLNAKTDECMRRISAIFTDADPDQTESSAKACLQDLRYAFQDAQFQYQEASSRAASAGLATGAIVVGLLDVASISASAYHGYKRNNSAGWAVWWGFMGALFPVITPAVAIAQGFGKREKK